MTKRPASRGAILFAIAATQFSVPFMISAVGVVLPVMGLEFQAKGVALSLVESVYLGINAMSLLCFGKASDLMGRNWIFTTGLAIFSLSTATIGFANSIYTLIAIRAVQALGGAMIVSTGLAILFSVYPREERGKALGIALACVYLGLSAGPFLGGHISETMGWRGVFFIGVTPCLLSLLMIFRALEWDYRKPDAPFDYRGALTSMAAIGLLLYGGAHADSLPGQLALGGCVPAFLLFIRLESRSANPLLNLELFTDSMDFSTGNLLQFINYSATFGITFMMSLYLQLGLGLSPMQAGTVLVIQPLVQSVLSPLCGRLADRVSPEILVTTGMFMCIFGLGWASTFDAATSMITIYTVLALMGTGVALFVSPNMKMIMRSVEPRHYGIASAVTGQMRIVGMTVSMVAISMMISIVVGDRVLDADTFPLFNRAMRFILCGGCAVGAMGMCVSILAPAWKRRARRKTLQGDNDA